MTIPVAEAHLDPPRARRYPAAPRIRKRIALLGLGRVGSAVARLVLAPESDLALDIAGVLVRDTDARSGLPFPVVAEPRTLLDADPDVVVEVLGGIEPARSIVLRALDRGIPVVTANKSLLARCGDELFEASARTGTPLRYESAVIAGVPFLCAFSGRPFASRVTRVTAILNGTSNFILSRVASNTGFAEALDLARRRGYAEPDASLDLDGTDAAEKLAILARHFGRLRVPVDSIPRQGIEHVTNEDVRCAAAFGGTIKPIAYGEWLAGATLWVGPAFIRPDHPLFSIRDVTNGIWLESSVAGSLVLVGPGAGPEVTAATILDDVVGMRKLERAGPVSGPVTVTEAPTGWLIRFRHVGRAGDRRYLPDLLASFGVGIERTSIWGAIDCADAVWVLTHACERGRIEAALGAVRSSTRCDTFAIRAVDAPAGQAP
jgi:homoserine dehydrogenase